MNNKLKIIFAGTPDFATPSLSALLEDNRFNIIAVITSPDKPIGRKQEMTPPPVKKLAMEKNIEVWQPEKIKEVAEKIKNAKPDFLVVVAYGKLVPESVLSLPKYGCVNVHGSILPRFRGASVIQAPILAGDTESGVTVMLMDKGLDTGPILKIAKTKIDNNETGESLHDKLSILGAQTLPEVLIDLASGKIKPQAQEGESFYCPETKKENGKIDWSKSAIEIERMIRAYTPWPGTFTVFEHQPSVNKTIKILAAESEILPINKYGAGKVFLNDGKLCVQCGEGSLLIDKLQIEGGKPLLSDEFLRGRPDFIGKVLA
jgi:methionyl-tRNA formyltransferase